MYACFVTVSLSVCISVTFHLTDALRSAITDIQIRILFGRVQARCAYRGGLAVHTLMRTESTAISSIGFAALRWLGAHGFADDRTPLKKALVVSMLSTKRVLCRDFEQNERNKAKIRNLRLLTT
jgi:hypothetical protein